MRVRINSSHSLKAGLSFFIIQLMMLWLCLPQAIAEQETLALDARLVGDQKTTRFVLDVSTPVSFRYFTLAEPYRVIVDIPNVKFNLPNAAGNQGRGLVSAYRFGLFAPGKSRIVIDLSEPAAVQKIFVLPPKDGQPGRFVIDFVPVTQDVFLANMERDRQKRQNDLASLKQKQGEGGLNSTEPALRPQMARPQNKKPVIVLDPGHGGIDSGAVGSGGTREKDVVLSFAILLKEELLKRKRFRVQMTRDTDIFIPLRERVNIARQKEADLFVSLHADSAGKPDSVARGASIYTLSEEASDAQAQLLAASENRSDIIAGMDLNENTDEVSNILIDLARRETKNHSVTFANILVGSMKESTIVKKEPLRYANFVVLRAPDVPSVLIELGYISSSRDELLLKSEEWREKVTVSVADAIEKYFANEIAPLPF